jgi:hypothetical protein|tara:strand:+ start:181 stop:453 length:273 start_codon:yes stop_codon:yes gene_type:complete
MRASQLVIDIRGCRAHQSLSLLTFNAQAALREALGASGVGGRSATAYSQLVAAEAEKEAAVERRDYSGQQQARDQCDVLRAELVARSAER